MYRLSVLFLAVLMAGCLETANSYQSGIVTNVVDGDTIKVQTATELMTVRFLGIDTPETYGGVQCYGPEAKEYTTNNILGKSVLLYPDTMQGDKDVFSRYLRYVQVGSVDFGAQLVREGYARTYTKIKSGRTSSYLILERTAQSSKAGLWGAC